MLKMKKQLVLLFVVLFMISCASTGLNTMTPKQQATVWIGIYNSQYDDTYAIMTNPLSTSVQKEIGMKKKAILTQVWPLLKTYIMITDSGGVPSNTDTMLIIDLINQLTTIAIIK